MDGLLLYWFAAGLLVIAGIAGLILPALPGAPLIWAGLLLAAWAEDFAYVGWWTVGWLTLLALLTYAADFWATLFGAKKFGASKRAIIGALLGLALGIFFGQIGVIFGPFVGALLGELSARRGVPQAARAGFGATLGLLIGAALKITLALAMLGTFAVVRFFSHGGM